MIVEPMSLVELYDEIRDRAKKKGYKWIVIFVSREADAKDMYDQIDEYWASLDDVTYKRIAFVFSGKLNHEKLSFYHSKGRESYVGRACLCGAVVGEDTFKNDVTSYRYISNYKGIDWRKMHTQSISEFAEKKGIEEDKIPGLFIYNYELDMEEYIPLSENTNIYDFIKRFVSMTQKFDSDYEVGRMGAYHLSNDELFEYGKRIDDYGKSQDESLKKEIIRVINSPQIYKNIKNLITEKKIKKLIKTFGQRKRQLNLEEYNYYEDKRGRIPESELKKEWRENLLAELRAFKESEKNNYEKSLGIDDLKCDDVKDKVDIGVIVALPEENAAMLKILGEVTQCFPGGMQGNRYEIGQIKGADTAFHNVAVMTSGENNNSSAIACTSMVRDFPNIKAIIMCGIAAGIPNTKEKEKSIHLGDVIVATEIVNYEYGKETENGFIKKDVSKACASFFKKASDAIMSELRMGSDCVNKKVSEYAEGSYKRPQPTTDKYRVEHNEYADKVVVHFGTIASGNRVVKRADFRENLREGYGAIAIEMEGAGVADSAHDCTKGFAVVRGVCDYGDENKDDKWHSYAALSAAAYTYVLIEHLPVGR